MKIWNRLHYYQRRSGSATPLVVVFCFPAHSLAVVVPLQEDDSPDVGAAEMKLYDTTTHYDLFKKLLHLVFQ